jgi:DNA-binding NarL/FixJ family response regulator
MSSNKSAVPFSIRVLLVDDHPAVRQGLGLLLATEGICVCAEAGKRSEALECLEEARPDLALVDLSLGGESGIALIADMNAHSVPALVYSMHEDAQHIESAFAAGALGYVTKRELHGVLMQAIREVVQGHRFVSPKAAVAMADHAAKQQFYNCNRELSDQEKQVYELLGEGEGTIEIAALMHISARTVESYYARIMEKFGINGMRDLRRHAINHLRNRTF